MRTTLKIDEDILQAAKELAAKDNTSVGEVISGLARKGLNLSSGSTTRLRGGVPVLPSRGEVISLEHVQKLIDQEGV